MCCASFVSATVLPRTARVRVSLPSATVCCLHAGLSLVSPSAPGTMLVTDHLEPQKSFLASLQLLKDEIMQPPTVQNRLDMKVRRFCCCDPLLCSQIAVRRWKAYPCSTSPPLRRAFVASVSTYSSPWIVGASLARTLLTLSVISASPSHASCSQRAVEPADGRRHCGGGPERCWGAEHLG